MKLLSTLIVATVLFSKISFAQSSSVDGKSYAIILYVQKEKDSVDTLMFQNNSMTFSTARRYGFVIESIKPKEKSGSYHFVAKFKSEKNGEMIWEGTVKNDEIEGTCIWDKMLQNPINCTFTGKEIKNP